MGAIMAVIMLLTSLHGADITTRGMQGMALARSTAHCIEEAVMANQGLGNEHKAKCAHQGCACLVEPSQSFCSEHCARESTAAGSANLPGGKHSGGPCECRHAACQAGAART